STGDGRFLALFIHVVIAVLAILITNATGGHAIARAAHRSGVKPAMAEHGSRRLEMLPAKNDMYVPESPKMG
ncbi:monovalent cation/H(+) antiporter subunit G, partial [Acetomicrobium sp. S15 = DSM 107314]|uniref:monovalent cation/H(+) antiporter subunit G n=1 Tax=Acetomicrobium sp. S15 = DSM 107314 TaxID=2529858 RepID=UPI0018E0F701